jgi:hypothetical protein
MCWALGSWKCMESCMCWTQGSWNNWNNLCCVSMTSSCCHLFAWLNLPRFTSSAWKVTTFGNPYVLNPGKSQTVAKLRCCTDVRSTSLQVAPRWALELCWNVWSRTELRRDQRWLPGEPNCDQKHVRGGQKCFPKPDESKQTVMAWDLMKNEIGRHL